MCQILVIDDEPDILSDIEDYFGREGYNISTISNPKEAFKKFHTKNYDLLIVDYKMPHYTGLDLLIEAKKNNAYNYGIMFTAYADKDLLEKVINKNLISKLIEKPIDFDNLRIVIDEGIKACKKKSYKEIGKNISNIIIDNNVLFEEAFNEIKDIVLEEILTHYGSILEASKRTGIPRSTFYRSNK